MLEQNLAAGISEAFRSPGIPGPAHPSPPPKTARGRPGRGLLPIDSQGRVAGYGTPRRWHLTTVAGAPPIALKLVVPQKTIVGACPCSAARATCVNRWPCSRVFRRTPAAGRGWPEYPRCRMARLSDRLAGNAVCHVLRRRVMCVYPSEVGGCNSESAQSAQPQRARETLVRGGPALAV